MVRVGRFCSDPICKLYRFQDAENMTTRKIPDAWKHKVKTGYPIRSKWIKGHEYAYQRLDSGRDPNTGKVWVRDHHLGAWKPARQKPIMDQLTAKDQERITAAYQGGEDVDLIVERVRAYTGETLTADPVYVWFRKHGITRGARTTKQAEKRISTAAMKVERVQRLRAEDKAILARQAKRRAQARKEIERSKK